MNRKGEIGITEFLVVFIGIIVGLVLFVPIGQFVGTATGANLATYSNQSITMPAIGSSADLNGQELVGTPVVTNSTITTGGRVPATNFTIDERVDSQGLKGVVLTSKGGDYVGSVVNISYQSYPDGYIDNAGGRSMALLIPIFVALATMVIGLMPSVREKFGY